MSNNKGLIDFISKTSPQKLQVEEDLGSGYVRLNVSEAQRRQAKHDIRTAEDALVELLRNSHDANATKIYIASWKENNLRKIVVIDNGQGIPEHLQKLIFEPRVTSKLNSLVIDKYGVHGRGMALYSISENCLLAKITESKRGVLTAIKLVIDTNQLPEKANQSTWPTFDSKGRIKEGPRNFIRHCLEFNLAHPSLSIFIGSPTQILTTLEKESDYITKEQNASILHKEASQIGLEVSFRNCQRIIYNEINSLEPVLKQINYKTTTKSKKQNLSNFLSSQDLELILEKTKEIVDENAREYFITVSDDANIIKVSNKLKIILPLEIKE